MRDALAELLDPWTLLEIALLVAPPAFVLIWF
jgi:hypothetical protein